MDFGPLEEVLPQHVPLRLCIQTAYRLLRAMCVGLPPVQMEVVKHMDVFVQHAGAKLSAHDVSPSGLISAIHHGNRSACEQATEELINYFVDLAAAEHAPRYLRFLRMLVMPEGRTHAAVSRNQSLVMQALRANKNALLLFNDGDGLRERKVHAALPAGCGCKCISNAL